MEKLVMLYVKAYAVACQELQSELYYYLHDKSSYSVSNKAKALAKVADASVAMCNAIELYYGVGADCANIAIDLMTELQLSGEWEAF